TSKCKNLGVGAYCYTPLLLYFYQLVFWLKLFTSKCKNLGVGAYCYTPLLAPVVIFHFLKLAIEGKRQDDYQ
ncbi:hypothetical protein MEO93_20305, partial [Dolichospermum sp. ST_sed3]|nr:hypothetical protein [Dolichospermum sp. ST_sed3]